MITICIRLHNQKDSPIDIEEIEIPEYSWIRFKRLKETKLREMTNADVVGIKEPNNKFTPMPNGDYLIDLYLVQPGFHDFFRALNCCILHIEGFYDEFAKTLSLAKEGLIGLESEE